MKALLKRVITDALNRRDYDLKDVQHPLRKAPAFFRAMKPKGLNPGTVIDVGVGFGTPWLMEGFPDAYTVLIEPNDGFREPIEQLMTPRKGEVHFTAAGREAGQLTLNLNVLHPTSSSLSKPSARQVNAFAERGWTRETREVTVPVTRLDALDRSRWPKPYLLKVDSEGFELEVLAGATGLFPDLQCLIAEVSIAERYEGGYDLATFISTLDSYGFRLFDITDMLQFGRSGRLSTIDAVFLPKGSPLLNS